MRTEQAKRIARAIIAALNGKHKTCWTMPSPTIPAHLHYLARIIISI
jgi:hypothetical protein